ncbi:MAG: S-layer homology domain-containing protein [Clostridia bacterium]|nr:S-layer homology domain-containing protein [Clostridia bacterium]
MKRFVALAAALCIILSVSAAGAYSDKDKISPSAAEAVELMYDLDIMRGDGVNFRPNANITREEMFRVVYSLTSVGGRMTEAEQGYWSAVMEEHAPNVPDADKIASWAYPYAGYCLEKGYFVGSSDGSLRPKSEIGAVECATVLLRLLGYTETDFHAGCSAGVCYWASNVTLLSDILGLLNGVSDEGYGAGVTRENVAVMIGNALASVHSTDPAGRMLIDVLFGIRSIEEVVKTDVLISADGRGGYVGVSGRSYDFGELAPGYSLLRKEVSWVEAEGENGKVYIVPPSVITEGWSVKTLKLSEITSVLKGTVYVYDNGGAEPSHVVDFEHMLTLDNNPYDVMTLTYKDGVILCNRAQTLFRTAEDGRVTAVTVDALTGETRTVGAAERMYTDEGFSTEGLDIPIIRFEGRQALEDALVALPTLDQLDGEAVDTDSDGLADRILKVRSYVEMYEGFAVGAGQEVTDLTPELELDKGESAVVWLVEGPTVRKDSNGTHADYIGYVGDRLVRVSDIEINDTSDAVGSKGGFIKAINYGTPTYNPNVFTYKRMVLELAGHETMADYGYVSQYVGIEGYDYRVQLISLKGPAYSGERIIDTDRDDCPYEDVVMLSPLKTRLASDGNTNWKNAYFVLGGKIYFIPVGCLVY